MNIYKYAKRHADRRLDLSLILDSHRECESKSKSRLLMVHWLAWYYKFARMGYKDAAKDNMRYFIAELKEIPYCK